MATVTITTTAPNDARIAPAAGAFLNLGRNATGAEVKGLLIRYLTNIVLSYECDQAAVAAQAAVTPITPT